MGLAALHALKYAGRRGLSQVELAGHLGKSATSATRLIDSLEVQGMVARSAHPHDRRIKVILLTDVGQELLASVLKDVSRAIPSLFEEAPDLDSCQTQLIRLARFSRAISEEVEERAGTIG